MLTIHARLNNESAKVKRIREIAAEKEQVRIEILVHELRDEKTALKIEASVTDLLDPTKLTNAVRG